MERWCAICQTAIFMLTVSYRYHPFSIPTLAFKLATFSKCLASAKIISLLIIHAHNLQLMPASRLTVNDSSSV